MESKAHWVEELFPPAYSYTLDGILHEPLPADDVLPRESSQDQQTKEDALANKEATVGKRKDVSNKMTLFDQLARQIRPGDVSSIKNVYERVWLMVQLEHEEKQKRAEDCKKEGTPPKDAKVVVHRRARVEVCDVATSTADLDAMLVQVDTDDSCIWSTQEIGILRKVFQATKQQNLKLLGKLEVMTEDLQKLQKTHKKQAKSLDSRSHALHEAKKANQRLNILSQNLKGLLDKTNAKIAILEEDLYTFKKERKSHLDAVQKLQVELDKERIDRKRVEIDLANKHKETLREIMLREENLEVMHEQDMDFLQRDIRDLQKQLEQEKKDHDRTKKGLEQLRTHFSSLPYAGEKEQAGMVTQDQLSAWSY